MNELILGKNLWALFVNVFLGHFFMKPQMSQQHMLLNVLDILLDICLFCVSLRIEIPLLFLAHTYTNFAMMKSWPNKEKSIPFKKS